MIKIVWLFLISFLIFTSLSFAQIRVYEDLQGNRIDHEYFWKHPDRAFSTYAYRASGDTVITFLYKGSRDFNGKLDSNNLQVVKERFDFGKNNAPIIIQFFHGVDDCSKHYVSRRKELIIFLANKNRKIRKIGGKVYNLYKSNKNVELISDRLKWVKDEGGYIESLFFEYHFPCGSYIVINNKGEFRGTRSEYGDYQIKEDFKILSKN